MPEGGDRQYKQQLAFTVLSEFFETESTLR